MADIIKFPDYTGSDGNLALENSGFPLDPGNESLPIDPDITRHPRKHAVTDREMINDIRKMLYEDTGSLSTRTRNGRSLTTKKIRGTEAVVASNRDNKLTLYNLGDLPVEIKDYIYSSVNINHGPNHGYASEHKMQANCI